MPTVREMTPQEVQNYFERQIEAEYFGTLDLRQKIGISPPDIQGVLDLTAVAFASVLIREARHSEVSSETVKLACAAMTELRRRELASRPSC